MSPNTFNSVNLKTMTLFQFILSVFFSCIGKPQQEEQINISKLDAWNKEALHYCKENQFNEAYYFLLDFSIHSGKNRFFIYDFKKEEVLKSALVTHGACDIFEANPKAHEKAKFSNAVNSHCSSLGKYKIGKRDYSSWGINVKYWLHGLDTSNNKASERVVVLHSWSAVSDTEIHPVYSVLSWGCPAVSDNFMKHLDSVLQKSAKPVLLWIVD